MCGLRSEHINNLEGLKRFSRPVSSTVLPFRPNFRKLQFAHLSFNKERSYWFFGSLKNLLRSNQRSRLSKSAQFED